MSLFDSLGLTSHRSRKTRRPKPQQLALEALEDRCLMTYTVIHLDTQGGRRSYGYGLNDTPTAAGESQSVANRFFKAAIWDQNGVKTEIGMLPTGRTSNAQAINNDGNVVGSSNPTPNPSTYHAFYWNGGFTDLGTLGGTPNSYGRDVNIGEQIVGFSEYSGGPAGLHHATYWSSPSAGAISDIHPVGMGGNDSRANGINDAGDIAGYSTTSSSGIHPRAIFWDAPSLTPAEIPMLPDWGLGSPVGGEAHAVNNAAQPLVAGGDYVIGGLGLKAWRAFLWNSVTGAKTDLGDLGLGGKHAIAYDVNDSGAAVGEANTTFGDSPRRAFIWDPAQGSVMKNLNDLIPSGTGWVLEYAYNINNDGWIVGAGRLNGLPRGFLLKPDTPLPPSPGPSVDPASARDVARLGIATPVIFVATEQPTARLAPVANTGVPAETAVTQESTPTIRVMAAAVVDADVLTVSALSLNHDPLA
jgi:probable HAF family extracellular repeat protein